MKKILYVIVLLLSTSFYWGCADEDYSLQRLPSPTDMTATKGDTSVFLKWNKVEGASFYTIVRGLKVIADSIVDDSYEDALAPDTAVEYRIYSVNAQGWRSATYAADSGFLGIPAGIMPRKPVKVEASTDDYKGCNITWSTGRFAISYKLYRDDKFLADVTGNSYMDYDASTSSHKYSVVSVNSNGTSATGAEANGKKAFVLLEDYENYSDNNIINPWTFCADRIGYYTEGNPTVLTEKPYDGKKSLRIQSGKIQLLYDWGGVKAKGYYVISFYSYKDSGSFGAYNNFGGNVSGTISSKWEKNEFKTGLLEKGNTFNVTIHSQGDSNPLYIDNLSIEYIYSE